MQKQRIRHQHAHTQQPPHAVIVHETQHNAFRESTVQPAAEQLRVNEFGGGVDGGEGVARHAGGVGCGREGEEEEAAEGAHGLDVEEEEAPEPGNGY